MTDTLAIIPGNGTEGYVELSQETQNHISLSRAAKGRVFEKHILNYGPLLYPGAAGGKVMINDSFADKLIANFTNKVCDIVQVPKAGPNNEHSEDPDRNIGEVIGLTKRNGKVYAQIDARDEEAASKLGKTLLGASAMMHLNYTDTRTLKTVGPTLLHVAVTNRPYVVDLDEYKEIGEVVAASADGNTEAVVLTAPNSKEKSMSTLDELLAELRTDHGIDVPALQEQAAKADDSVKLSNALTSQLAESGVLKLSNGDTASVDDVVAAVAEVHTKNVELSNQVEGLVKLSAEQAADTKIAGLIRSGHILPVQKDAQKTLLLSNPELFEQLLPEKPLVKLSQPGDEERGFETVDETHKDTVDSEIARLSASSAAAPYVRGAKA